MRSLTRSLSALAIFCAAFPVSSSALPGPHPRVVHVFVALADNAHQGIVPVPKKLGDGDDAQNNLYWGAAYGVKTYFQRHGSWRRVKANRVLSSTVIDSVVFKHQAKDAYLVADAYRGSEIRQAIHDFLTAAAGGNVSEVRVDGERPRDIRIGGGADLIVYVGHDGLMDFDLDRPPRQADNRQREVVILACASKKYFAAPVRATGARPLLWTTGLMAPEAYTLAATLDGWLSGESSERIRDRAALEYHRHQRCGVKAAKRLLAAGW